MSERTYRLDEITAAFNQWQRKQARTSLVCPECKSSVPQSGICPHCHYDLYCMPC
jgi:uncharacterized paraquat-inducible protein A